ncbi:MAG TPA: hypothetical protein VIF15_08755 [Polyangiaceae bacterium]
MTKRTLGRLAALAATACAPLAVFACNLPQKGGADAAPSATAAAAATTTPSQTATASSGPTAAPSPGPAPHPLPVHPVDGGAPVMLDGGAWPIPSGFPSTLPPIPSGFPSVLPSNLPPIPSHWPPPPH